MSDHGKVQNIQPLDPAEIFEFVGAVVEQLPRKLDPAKVRWYLEKKSRIGKDIQPLFAQPAPAFDTSKWDIFYKSHFNYTDGFDSLHVPEKPTYPCRALVVVPTITNNQVFDACKQAFPSWRYTDDLDTIVDVVRRPQGPYVVWARDVVEADEEMKNMSANDIERQGLNTLTLKERMLLELVYFDAAGKHLDIENWTLCAGSRYPDGYVPACSWRGDGFNVYWTLVASRYSNLRARLAVS